MRVMPIAIAFFTTVVYVAAIPILAYSGIVGIAIVQHGDMGGPLNLAIIPLAGLAAGIVCGLLFALISPVAQRMRGAAVAIPFVLAAIVFVPVYWWTRTAPWFSAAVAVWIGSASAVFLMTETLARRVIVRS